MPDAFIRSATAGALRERASGLVLTLCAFALVTVWLIDTPLTVRFSVTVAITLVCASWFTLALRRRARLGALRESQLMAHRAVQKASTTTPD